MRHVSLDKLFPHATLWWRVSVSPLGAFCNICTALSRWNFVKMHYVVLKGDIAILNESRGLPVRFQIPYHPCALRIIHVHSVVSKDSLWKCSHFVNKVHSRWNLERISGQWPEGFICSSEWALSQAITGLCHWHRLNQSAIWCHNHATSARLNSSALPHRLNYIAGYKPSDNERERVPNIAY